MPKKKLLSNLSFFNKFIDEENISGIILFGSLLIALVWINSPKGSSYDTLWASEMVVNLWGHLIHISLHHLINDGLMSLFFFVVGLELKREFLTGELASAKRAVLPIAAAAGGMLFPACIYYLFNRGQDSVSGWGIPMATDIAFAVGLLAFIKDKVPAGLKVFLTALAIADDLGAVGVIAFFYTSSLSLPFLAFGCLGICILKFANRVGVMSLAFYIIAGILLVWIPFLLSGVHVTIAGVLVAFTIPSRSKNQSHINQNAEAEFARSPLQQMEQRLHPWIAFFVMPLFALSNAGVRFSASMLETLFNPVTLGVGVGLLLGKFLGIFSFSALLVKSGIASLPSQSRWLHLAGVSLLAGVGFTMSLFVTNLAFSAPVFIDQAKAGILAASLLAGCSGILLFKYLVK